jgi:hypothetical protein
MKSVYTKLILLLLLGSSITSFAQIDNLGRAFWLAFTPNSSNAAEYKLFISSSINGSGTVEIPGLGFNESFTVTAGTITTVDLPSATAIITDDGIEDKGIHVTSDVDIAVYGLSSEIFTADAFLGIPVDALGQEHHIISYDTPESPLGGTHFGVVSIEDNTLVTITPSITVGTRIAGVPYTVTMNQGEVYQLGNPTMDLTGTKISSDKPVSIFGGHQCANVPVDVSSCDHLVEQIPPSTSWGQSFLTASLATRTAGDIFRILAAEDATEVRINGTLVATLNSGEFHEADLPSDSYNEIEATGPVLLAQYSKGRLADNTTSDPFMMLIPPFEQFLNTYLFTTPATGFSTNFVNIIVADADIGTVRLDGTIVPANEFTAIGSSGFSGARLPLSIGSHTLMGGLPFGAFVYGFDFANSYGYPAGQAYAAVATIDDLVLTPATSENIIGDMVTVTAKVTNDNGDPIPDLRVDFAVTGANTAGGFGFTDANGEVAYSYTGNNAGADAITASVGPSTAMATATFVIVDDLSLSPSTAEYEVEALASVVATVLDQNGDPIPNLEITFTVTGANPVVGSGITDANGQVTYSYEGLNLGDDLVTASFESVTAMAMVTFSDDPEPLPIMNNWLLGLMGLMLVSLTAFRLYKMK